MIYSDNERRVLFRKICSLMLIKCFTGLQQHKHKTKRTQVTPHPTIRPESYKAQPSARGHPQIPHFITRPSIPDWSKSMQDNSQRPRPSITPPLPPPPHNPSMHPPPNPPIYHPPRTPLAVPTSTRSPPFFLLCPAFSIPSIRPHILTSRLRPPLTNSRPLFPLHLTCLFSSLLCIITLIRRGACNAAVVYNMSVVITDSLAALH